MNGMERIEDFHISGPIKGNLEEIKELQRNKGPFLTGLQTGFTLLDRITSGLNKSDLIILASFPHWGKTPFALNIARNVAVDRNIPVLIFSLEATEKQVSMRMLSAEAKVSETPIRTGCLGEEEWDRLRKASDTLSKAPIYIDASPGISIVEIEIEAREMKKKKGTFLIIIDYLQLIKGKASPHDRPSEYREMARALKRLAEKLNIPILLIFQLGDIDLEEHNYKEPTLIDLADTGSLDQDADLVLLISRDEIIHPCTEHCNRGRANIIIAKNRRGPKGSETLIYSHQYSLFKDFESP